MATVFRKRVDDFGKTIKHLEKEIGAMVASQKMAQATNSKFASVLRAMATTESFDQLQEALDAVAQSVENIETHREKTLGALTDSVVHRLPEIHEFVVQPTKLMLADHASVLKAVTKRAGQVNEFSLKQGSTVKSTKSQHLYDDELKRHKNVQSMVLEKMQLFERQRVLDLKTILQSLLRSQLYYHCRAIEQLSSSLSVVETLKAGEAVEKILSELEHTFRPGHAKMGSAVGM